MWKLFKFFGASILQGLLLAFISFFVVAVKRPPALSQFTFIQIGMKRDDVQKILSNGAITCGLSFDPLATQCTFSDSWRTYIVELDPTTGRVVRKGFMWSGPAFYYGPRMRY